MLALGMSADDITEAEPPFATERTPTPAAAAAAALELPPRYEDLGIVGRGGWGEVRRVRDHVLHRNVVMKILAPDVASASARARFLHEARVTASLEHPGIVPVHDAGVLGDQRPFFVMKEVKGRTLSELVRDRYSFAATPLRRWVEHMLRVAEAVGYAHERGVLHRDLKPGNVMVGSFGEVLVLDWGIARVDSTREGSLRPPSSVERITGRHTRATRRRWRSPSVEVDGISTQVGDILGTPGYMSPEQARGANQELTPASDVFSLGLMLYEVLTGLRPRGDDRVRAWAHAAAGIVPSVETPEASRMPPELAELVSTCTSGSPAARPANGLAFAESLRAWLDGAARRALADEAVEHASSLLPEIEELTERRDNLRVEARRLLVGVHEWEPVAKKRPAWRLEDEAAEIEQRLAVLEAERIEGLGVALQHDPDHEGAHDELAHTYRARVIEAEARRAAGDVARYEHLLRQHDRGEHTQFLQGLGRLELDTEPSGATVRALRYTPRDRRLVPREIGVIGKTPVSADLPIGSYLMLIEREGHAPVRYPVLIERAETWSTVPPGESRPRPLRLLPTLGDDEIYVPAGWAIVGGDELAVEPVPRARPWIDGFVMQRHPVTVRAYAEYLDDLHAQQGLEAALARAPRRKRPGTEASLAMELDASGRFVPTPDEHEETVQGDFPVCWLTWFDAEAYARWLAARTGLPWRLPDELEWEKAARGVDGRAFPWGDFGEPTYACMIGAIEGVPRRVSVHAYPTDESPYGVRGMAGNVRDVCGNRWTADGPPVEGGRLVRAGTDPAADGLAVVRGGSWTSVPAFARAAGRFATRVDDRYAVVGLRLVRSIEGG
jgi:serine/threonine-protein kinase